MKVVEGTQEYVKPIEVGDTTVYVRTNIHKVYKPELDMEVNRYNQETYSIREFMEKLTLEEHSQSMVILLSILMSEVDYLRTELDKIKGVS